MINKPTYPSLPEAIRAIDSTAMDSTFENSSVYYLSTLGVEDKWQYIEALLTNPSSKVRSLGLRVVRRGLRDRELLEKIAQLCFTIDRLSALQYWYAAILARYPIARFGRLLKGEIEKRRDENFNALHLRALEMHPAKGSKKKKIMLDRIKQIIDSYEP